MIFHALLIDEVIFNQVEKGIVIWFDWVIFFGIFDHLWLVLLILVVTYLVAYLIPIIVADGIKFQVAEVNDVKLGIRILSWVLILHNLIVDNGIYDVGLIRLIIFGLPFILLLDILVLILTVLGILSIILLFNSSKLLVSYCLSCISDLLIQSQLRINPPIVKT